MIASLLGRSSRPDDGEVAWPATGSPLVEARDLVVDLGGHRILDGVDLVCRAGELVALVGPNGAGKSTLLGALSGDVEPAAGEVLVHGAPLGSWPEVDLARRRAVLLQQNRVGFPFTVEQVVSMGRAPWRGTPAEDLDEPIVADALGEADVEPLRLRRVNTLSGGEAARVALARLLAQRTQLALLDEPTAALDLHHQEHAMAVLRRLADTGRPDGRPSDTAGAVVVVLHDLGLAAAHADRIVVIDRGRIVADGTPLDVLQPDLLGAVYRHPVDVVSDPRSGAPLVVPRRTPRPAPSEIHTPDTNTPDTNTEKR